MSCRSFAIVVATLIGLCSSLTTAYAESRVALVIGNSAYQSVPTLPNPINDAASVGDLLKSAGFEVVVAPDLTQTAMRRAIADFVEQIHARGPDTIALVFYAGHGLQVDGENFLIPVDANIARESDVPLEAVRLADLMNALAEVPAKVRIVMLDACRNNPFSAINRVTGRGLAIVDAPAGSIVSYSTSPGMVAQDGDGDHSPYTTAFLTVVREPGVPIEQALKRMRYAVHGATNQQQTPWESSSLTSDFAFFPQAAGTAPQPVNTPPQAGGTPARPPGTPAQPGSTPARPPGTLPQPVNIPLQPGSGGPGQRGATVPKPPARTIESWKLELQRYPAAQAYAIVVWEDTVEAYQAYLALFTGQFGAPRVRLMVNRRTEMLAWHTAVTVNSLVSYQSFLARYSRSDLAPTAQRLAERARNRSLGPDASANAQQPANLCPCTQQPGQTPPFQRRAGLPPPIQQQTPPPNPTTRAYPPVTPVIPPRALPQMTPPPVVNVPPPPNPITRGYPPPSVPTQVTPPPVVYVPSPRFGRYRVPRYYYPPAVTPRPFTGPHYRTAGGQYRFGGIRLRPPLRRFGAHYPNVPGRYPTVRPVTRPPAPGGIYRFGGGRIYRGGAPGGTYRFGRGPAYRGGGMGRGGFGRYRAR